MAGSLDLRVVTPEKPVYEGQAESVVVPAHDGAVGILPRHARFLASLGVGELRAKTKLGVERFFVEGGFVQVSDDRVTVLCDRATRLDDLDEDAVTAAAAAVANAPEGTSAAERSRLQQRATVMRRVLSQGPRSH